MEKPKKTWLLYLDKVEGLKDYNYCEGRELSRNDKFATLEITSTFGNREKLPEHLSKIIDIPLEHLRLGKESSEDVAYFKYCIKEINTKYFDEKGIWYLKPVFGSNASLEVINERNGIVDDETVEEIARRCKLMYSVLETKTGGLLISNENRKSNIMGKCNVLENITSLEALQSYGIKDLEEVHEKTCVYVERGITTRRLRDKKIKDILND